MKLPTAELRSITIEIKNFRCATVEFRQLKDPPMQHNRVKINTSIIDDSYESNDKAREGTYLIFWSLKKRYYENCSNCDTGKCRRTH